MESDCRREEILQDASLELFGFLYVDTTIFPHEFMGPPHSQLSQEDFPNHLPLLPIPLSICVMCNLHCLSCGLTCLCGHYVLRTDQINVLLSVFEI